VLQTVAQEGESTEEVLALPESNKLYLLQAAIELADVPLQSLNLECFYTGWRVDIRAWSAEIDY
jgi:hypothetical protein